MKGRSNNVGRTERVREDALECSPQSWGALDCSVVERESTARDLVADCSHRTRRRDGDVPALATESVVDDGKTSRRRGRPTTAANVRVTAEMHPELDAHKLSRAFLALALHEAAHEAEAQRQHEDVSDSGGRHEDQ